MKYRFTVVTKQLPEVAKWVQERRGLLLWKNLEIGSSVGDCITPGDSGKPHWRYGEPQTILPSEIEVEHQKFIDPPPEWYPNCDKCNGFGKRSLEELARIRNETIEQVRQLAIDNPNWHWGPVEDDHFPCNFCNGTGHKVEKIKFKVKREYWGGYTVSQTGQDKCAAMCKRLKDHFKIEENVEWDWSHLGHGMAEAFFFSVWRESLDDYVNSLLSPSQPI